METPEAVVEETAVEVEEVVDEPVAEAADDAEAAKD